MVIVSKNNEKIKYINSLKEKKYREKYNRYIIEGIKIIEEYISLRGQNPLEFIVLSKELLEEAQGGIKLYEKLHKCEKVIEVDRKVFEYLSDTETPQGALIVIKKTNNTLNNLISNIKAGEKIIVLDRVMDSGNMGTIIRTAVSFGVNNIVCIKGCVDVYSPKVVRSTMGAIDKTNIFYIDNNELINLKDSLRENGYILCATDLKANSYLNEMKPNKNRIFVLGNEACGISKEVEDVCDEVTKIPMENIQESLNVAVAAAILMYNEYIGGNH